MTFRVVSPLNRKIIWVGWDLIGDGMGGWDVSTDDGRYLGGVLYFPQMSGTFQLVGYALDSQGCQGQTGAVRNVKVR